MDLCVRPTSEGFRHCHPCVFVLITLITSGFAILGCTGTSTPEATATVPPTEAAPTSTPVPTDTPIPRPTNTPTAAPTDAPAPTATLTPPPTRAPFTCPDPAAGDEPPFTTLPETEEGPVLAQVLSRLPTSYRDEGVWLADYGGAVELAGAPNPNSVEELLALSETESEEHLAATQGLIFPSNMLQRARQYFEEWHDAFGFDFLAASRMVSTGFDHGSPFGTTYLELKFDTEGIRQHLLDLGYQECAAAGGLYYAIRHDREQDIDDPVGRIASSTMNRVVLGDSWMATDPDTDDVVSFLDVAAGASTLMDEPPFASLAAELGDPLSGALLTRELALLEMERPIIDPDPPVRLPKPKHWGPLHQWEYLGTGFGITEGRPWLKFVLFYQDSDAAALDMEELSLRWEEYQLYQWHPQREPVPLTEVCLSTEFASQRVQDGSILSIHCVLLERSSAWWVILETRDLGFLLP
jgi:hypothetical protein